MPQAQSAPQMGGYAKTGKQFFDAPGQPMLCPVCGTVHTETKNSCPAVSAYLNFLVGQLTAAGSGPVRKTPAFDPGEFFRYTGKPLKDTGTCIAIAGKSRLCGCRNCESD